MENYYHFNYGTELDFNDGLLLGLWGPDIAAGAYNAGKLLYKSKGKWKNLTPDEQKAAKIYGVWGGGAAAGAAGMTLLHRRSFSDQKRSKKGEK